MSGVVVVGSANMDLVFECERIPSSGETLLGRGFRLSPGGKGANQAAAIGSLGGEVSLVAKVGNDPNGNALLDNLMKRGVNVSQITTTTEAPTGVAGIMVSDLAENIIVVVPGANGLLTGYEVRSALSTASSSVVLAQLEIPMEAVEACTGAQLFILNPAPSTLLPSDLLEQIDVITPNQSEAEAMTRIFPSDAQSCESAAKWYLERGVKAAVITLGSHGCFVKQGSRAEVFTPPNVTAIDTTGAGDAFSGALAHYLAEGREIWNAAQLANSVAAASTTRRGAQEAMPSMEDLKKIASHLL